MKKGNIPNFSESSKKELYKVKDIKDYVDKFARDHRISPYEAFDHAMVRFFIVSKYKKQMLNKE